MKMNNKMKALVQIVRGVILLAMGLSLMGCEQAKEVENINIQDTKPVVEEIEEVHYVRECEFCGARDNLTEEVFTEVANAMARDLAKEKDTEKYRYKERAWVNYVNFKGCTDCILAQDNADFTPEQSNEVTSHLTTCTGPHTGKVSLEAPTAMTAEEFDNAKCENCGHDVSDVIDNAGGYWCEACDYVK